MAFDTEISEETVGQARLFSADVSPDLCDELLRQYGMTLYEIIWFEKNINDTQIFKLLRQILDRGCEQINSPSILTPKVSLFFTAHQILSETIKDITNKIETKDDNTIFSNPLVHAIRQLPFEKRFVYLLRTKENFTYRDLETVSIRHRDEIGLFLTETREFLRIQLCKESLLPFSNSSDLCSETYKYLSPYLDNELNALNIMEIEKHLYKCEKCLQILANHQYIHKQVNNLHLISDRELLSHFWAETNINKKQKESASPENNQRKTPHKKHSRLFSWIRNLFG
ncbi:MAG: zf-HC2 domain-containing protein [Candidatus Hydrogenedens sp.]